jgi:hypothetical protein
MPKTSAKTVKLADMAERLSTLTAHSAIFLSVPRLGETWTPILVTTRRCASPSSALSTVCCPMKRGSSNHFRFAWGGLCARNDMDASNPFFIVSLHSALPLVAPLSQKKSWVHKPHWSMAHHSRTHHPKAQRCRPFRSIADASWDVTRSGCLAPSYFVQTTWTHMSNVFKIACNLRLGVHI